MGKNEKLKILFVSSEVDPFAKTGGLADVAGSMPQEVKNKGHDIRVVMPEYTQIDDQYLDQLDHLLHFRTQVGWRNNYVGINKLVNNGVPTYFVDNKQYFDRDSLYENEDKHVQFAFFCRAVLEMLPKIDFKPDIIHYNDWQTGPLSIMLKDQYQNYDFYQEIKTVYTIHNLRYQGVFGREILKDTLALHSKYWDNGVVKHDNKVNYMKMGIGMADAVNTVSKTYAEEIKTPYFGEGLDYVLRMNDDDLYGIVNGIDYDNFNPATDEDIYINYDLNNIDQKMENKLRLQEEMGLPQKEEVPLLGIVTRLVDQKGLDLILHILDDLLQQEEVQFLLLGTGQEEYENQFREIAARYPEKMSANIKYDAGLAQKIYAGSDMFLMPSKYEPCGLGQLISLRYGTIPIVRETGGLNDTVQSYNEATGEGNGFSFANYDAYDLLYTIRRAVDFYYNQPQVWEKLMRRGMKGDYSWSHSAEEYLKLYYSLLGREVSEVEVEAEAQGHREEELAADKLNINTAEAEDFEELTGIGPALAKRIVRYRNRNDGFTAKEEIKQVSGIGSKLYSDLELKIVCN